MAGERDVSRGGRRRISQNLKQYSGMPTVQILLVLGTETAKHRNTWAYRGLLTPT
jgi:hypothetical protein